MGGLLSSAMDHTSGPPADKNHADYSRVYWCTCTLSSNPVHVAHVAGDTAPGLRGPGNVASQSYRRGWSPSIQGARVT